MNEANNNKKIDATLADIKLVETTYETLVKAPYEKSLVLVNNFTGDVTDKGPGYGVRIPAFQTGYLVSIGKFDVKVMNPETQTGRYEQNIGLGEDISLSLKIKFQVGRNPQCMAKFLSQQETWKNAVKTASENIMKSVIDHEKDEIKKLIQASQYSDIRLDDVNLQEFIEQLNTPGFEPEGQAIALEAIKLKYNYGIELLNVTFVDVDVPERIKSAQVAAIEAEKQREIARQNAANEIKIERSKAANQIRIERSKAANKRNIEKKNSENEIEISKNKGKALKEEIEPLAKYFREIGYSNEQINEFFWRTYGIRYLPQNANVIYGLNSNNVSVPIMTNNYGYKENEEEAIIDVDQQESKGKARK